MAGFKEGSVQLRKKDSISPADPGHVKLLINSDKYLYTVDENGVSALIQGSGNSDGIKVYTTIDSNSYTIPNDADIVVVKNDARNNITLLTFPTPAIGFEGKTIFIRGSSIYSGAQVPISVVTDNRDIGWVGVGEEFGLQVRSFTCIFYSGNYTWVDDELGSQKDNYKVLATPNDETPKTLIEKLIGTDDLYITSAGPTSSSTLEFGTYGKIAVSEPNNGVGDTKAVLSNKLIAGSGAILEVVNHPTHGSQIKISLDGSGGADIDWSSLVNIPVASPSTSGIITSADYNNFSNHNITTGVKDFNHPITTYNPDGTITITSANVNLYDNSTFQGLIKTYNIAGQTLSLIDGAQQYIVADYNFGSPIFRIESNKNNINSSNVVCIYVTWRQGNNVHSIDFDSQGLQLPNKIAKSIQNTEPYKISVDGGLVLSETNTPLERTILVTSATVYAGTTPHQVSAFNSSTDILTFVNHVGGVWNYTAGTTQYNNTQYDNGTNLVTMTNTSKYAVRWFYRSIGTSKEVFYVLGDNEYNSISHAQLEAPRTDLPTLIKGHCMLLGRIIVKYGASSGLVENVSTTSFNATQVSNHNDLQNIQGGATGEYYHLSAATYTGLTSSADTNLHFHSSDRNRANHTGTQLASTISNFTTSVRSSLSATSPIVYSSATGLITHSNVGTSGIYTKIVVDSFGHTTSGGPLVASDIPTHNQAWSTITSIPTATSATSGVLSSIDWNTFNNKQASLTSASNILINNLSATNLYDTNFFGSKVLVSNVDKSLGESSISTTVLNHLSTTSADIQTQLSNLSATSNSVSALYQLTKEPTGFYTPENVIVTYSQTNRTITLSGQVSAYWRGVQVPFLSVGWVSSPHPTSVSASQYLYYDGTSVIWASTPWTFDKLHIAVVNIDQNGVVRFAIREPHGLMLWESHKECHNNIGTYINANDGGDLSNYTLDSTTNRRPLISSLLVNDEDLPTLLPALSTNAYTLVNNVGTLTNYIESNSDIILLSTNRPYFNQTTGGVWSNVLFANNSYGAIFVMAVPATSDAFSQSKRYLFIQPQVNGDLATIQALTPSSLDVTNLTNMTPEFVFFSKIIIKYSGIDWSITSVEKLVGNRNKQSSSSVTGLITVSTDNISISGTGISTDPIKLISIGTSGTYGNFRTNTFGQVISARNIIAADISAVNWNTITSVPTATSATLGILTSADWTTFNNKQSKLSGTTSQYVRGDGSLSAFPTNISTFVNNSGYITSAIADTRYVLQSTITRWTSATTIVIGQQTISASHDLNYQYSSVRCYNTTTNEMVILEPQYSISTPNVMVFNFNSSSTYPLTIVIEK